MYNAWCLKCKNMVQVPTEVDPKCPICKENVEIKGKVIRVVTSNGSFKPHI